MADILIIEDETALLDALTDGLGNAFPNMVVRGTTSAEDALPFIMQGHPLLIISDIKLPGKSGIDFLIETRKTRPGIKFVLMSAFAVVTREQAAARGAFRLIRKPFALKDLVASVREALADKTFKGDVVGISLIDLMQLIHLGRKTTAVFIARAGEIYFEAGEVVHARAGDQVGMDAFLALMRLGGGHFSTKPEAEAERRSIDTCFEHLMLEAVRIMDEETLDDLELEDVDIQPLPQPRYISPEERRARTRAVSANALIDASGPARPNASAETPHGADTATPQETAPSRTAESEPETLDRICRRIAEGTHGVTALGVVDLDSGMLVGAHGDPEHFDRRRLDVAGAALATLTTGRRAALPAQLLGGPADGEGPLDALFFSTDSVYHFSIHVRNSRCRLFMITRRAFNQGMGWVTLRNAADEVARWITRPHVGT